MKKPTIPQKNPYKVKVEKIKLISGVHVDYLKNHLFVKVPIEKRENLSH